MCLILIFFFLLKAGDTQPAQVVTPPKPSLTVSFERQNVRQNDCVTVELLIANESEHELATPKLEVSGPGFFKWYTGPCEKEVSELVRKPGAQSLPSVELVPIAAWSTGKQDLHFRTGDTIEVGEYNSLFIVNYDWKATQGPAKSFVSAEKSIKVNFLGNESVAGIPLALAGFIVPGLIFWLIIKVLGASWSIDGLSNQMIYSVMVSIAIVVIGMWLKVWDISTGISIGRLTTLAGVGAGFGLAAGATDLVIRRIITRRKKERQITRGESEFDLLGKILELPSANRLEKPVIKLKNGEEYSGSLGARTNVPGAGGAPDEEIVSLVGSYKIDWQKITDLQLKTRMRGFLEAGKWRQFVALASQQGAMDSVQQIELKNKDGEYDAISEPLKQWEAADIASTLTGSITWTAKPLDTE